LRHLCRSYTVHLGCFVDDPLDWQHIPELEKMCGGETIFVAHHPTLAKLACLRGLLNGDPLSAPYFYSAKLAAWVHRILAERRPDIVFICSSAMAQYVLDSPYRPRRMIMEFMDVDADKWRQYAEMRSGPMRWIYA